MHRSDHLYFEEDVVSPSLRRALTPRRRSTTTASDATERPDEFYLWLFERAGLPAEQYRSHALMRRSHACLRALGVKTSQQARRAIEADSSLLPVALNAVLLGVTAFYRDAVVFDKLQQNVLPDLAARRPRLQIWSAGCSEGHELYSVSLLLNELGCLSTCELLGTDCRATAIERGRSGIYPSESLGALDEQKVAKYFSSRGRFSVASDVLRTSTRWKVADLLAGVEPGPWDLILWRNMAIYLKSEAAEGVWAGLVRELRPGGYLVAGKADHPPATLGLRRIATCIYQRVEA